MSATVFSSRPSAASGISWKSLAKAFSLKASGAIFCAEKRASAQAARGLSGDAERDRDPLRGRSARRQSLDEPRLAAEQMRDAGNVEHQPVGPIERGERRVAGAPVAEAFEKLRLLRRARPRRRRERDGARARRRATGPGSGRAARLAASTPTSRLRVVDLGDGRERRAPVNAAEPPRAVGRQTRQPEGEKSPGRQSMSLLLASPLETDDPRPHRGRRRPLAPQPRRALTSRAAQANGPGRSRPAAAGLVRARRGGDLEARLGGARERVRLAIGARQHQKRGRPAFSRGEQQAARGGETVALQPPDLAHHHGRRAAFAAPPPSPRRREARRARARTRAGSEASPWATRPGP